VARPPILGGMGIVTGLAAAAIWLVLWSALSLVLGFDLPVAIVGVVAGLLAAFLIGVRLGDGRFRTDPVSRLEERQRARERFEASRRQLDTQDRQRRLERAGREAEERAEARVRELVERSRERRSAPGSDRGDEGEAGT
jgi:hypothetical protein